MPKTLVVNNSNGSTVSSDTDKANAFASNFEKSHLITINMGYPVFDEMVNQFVNNNFSNECIINFATTDQNEAGNFHTFPDSPFIKVSDVTYAIKSRNNKKSSVHRQSKQRKSNNYSL
ncbi:uncharacterized protein LOC119669440 [Teleopsis dalmanni]|uniref:uncharacterized protein LOC119669440 n=1 Tax=Teleopsis dalmanni TaxID=139649 RepID=UPI0018CD7B0A|nr:uncharacterized protein LOC119669440 [Teleopsis dalmanni]